MSLSNQARWVGTESALQVCESVFTKWLTDKYDLDVLRATLAAAACDKLTGDPAWLLVLGAPGSGKTETVGALGWIDESAEIDLLNGPPRGHALVTSTVTGPAALLSGTKEKERAKDATGGLLRKLGSSGVLVLKDVTSILSMSHDARDQTLGAFRETYDGKWTREMGADGGRSLEWVGRIVVIGAVTNAWDRAHAVVAKMGDRFAVLRIDANNSDLRRVIARQALKNLGSEKSMRRELGVAVGAVLDSVNPALLIEPFEQEHDALIDAAMVTTHLRTNVERDLRTKELEDVDQIEAATRFTKQLGQMFRGACLIGMDRADALRLAVRVARDSVPPMRLAVIEDIATHPLSITKDVAERLDRPYMTVKRVIEDLHGLGAVTAKSIAGKNGKVTWAYGVSDEVDLEALKPQVKSVEVPAWATLISAVTTFLSLGREGERSKESVSSSDETQTEDRNHEAQQSASEKGGNSSLPPHLHLFDHFAHWAGDDWFDADYAAEGAVFSTGDSVSELGRELFGWFVDLGLVELAPDKPSAARLTPAGAEAAGKVADLIRADAKARAKPDMFGCVVDETEIQSIVTAIEAAYVTLYQTTEALRFAPNNTKAKGARNKAEVEFNRLEAALDAAIARRDAQAEARWERLGPPTWQVVA